MVMDVLDHKGGHNGYEKKDAEMVYKITKENPFFLQYVPIFLDGIVKVDVVVMKVVNANNDEGERGSKEKDTVTNKKDKIANTYKIIFIFFLNALMWHEYEYYRNLVGLV